MAQWTVADDRGRVVVVYSPFLPSEAAQYALPTEEMMLRVRRWLDGAKTDPMLRRIVAEMLEQALGAVNVRSVSVMEQRLIGAFRSRVLVAFCDEPEARSEEASAAQSGKASAGLREALLELLSTRLYPALFENARYCRAVQNAGLNVKVGDPTTEVPRENRTKLRQAMAFYSKMIVDEINRAAALDPGSLKVEEIRGPGRYYRAEDSREIGKGSWVPLWWFDQKLWTQILTETEEMLGVRNVTTMSEADVIRVKLRRYLAISKGWLSSEGGEKKIDLVLRFELKDGDVVPGITGVGLSMGAIASTIPYRPAGDGLPYRPGGRSLGSPYWTYRDMKLPGGARQLWLPWTPNVEKHKSLGSYSAG